jgi:hypothetical protein
MLDYGVMESLLFFPLNVLLPFYRWKIVVTTV